MSGAERGGDVGKLASELPRPCNEATDYFDGASMVTGVNGVACGGNAPASASAASLCENAGAPLELSDGVK
jgi:hypothetical protein